VLSYIGWTIALSFFIPSGQSFVSNNYNYLRIYDGAYLCELRIYPNQIQLFSSQPVNGLVGNIDYSNLNQIIITGQNGLINVYLNGALIITSQLSSNDVT
jgi:protein gp37